MRASAEVRLCVLLFVLAIGAAACSSAAEVPSAGEAPSASAPTTSPDGATAKVLDFAAPQLGGGTIDGAQYGGKDLAIWFWAPW